ncbi:MAG TPA: UrcA family protein [Steroidobacteraceae bacterium]
MNTSIKQSIAALTFVTALACFSTAAQADQSAATSGESSAKIDFSDLDFSQPDAAAILYSRIEMSARLVCKDSSSPWDAGRSTTFQRCYTTVIEDAVARVNRPQLTALHREKTKPVLVGAATK